jgi:hypothetical protein
MGQCFGINNVFGLRLIAFQPLYYTPQNVEVSWRDIFKPAIVELLDACANIVSKSQWFA